MATSSDDIARIDQILADWRQGDATRDLRQFVHLANLATPLTPASVALAQERERLNEALGLEGVTIDVVGLVVVSQTCDIVRSCANKRFLEVAALVELPPSQFKEVQLLRRPGFVEVPALSGERLVGDLDRVMTIEKSILADWTRIPGCRNSVEARRFSRALARKRQRFAFPDDFVAFARPLEALLKQQTKASDSSKFHVDCVEEIRVIASPDWNASKVELQFLFIKNSDPLGDSDWSSFANQWMEVLGTNSRFSVQPAIVGYLRDFDAEAYNESDALDLDALSPSSL